MNKYLKYLKYVIKHKFYVGYFCFQEGLYIRGIFHDMHKFRWFPFKAYANYFYGDKKVEGNSPTGYSKPIKTHDTDFDKAWLFHQKTQKHHWQFWILQEDDGNIKHIPMDEQYWKEMIVDWQGASIATGKSNFRTYKENTRDWYLAHKHIIQLNPYTRAQVEKTLGIYFT